MDKEVQDALDILKRLDEGLVQNGISYDHKHGYLVFNYDTSHQEPPIVEPYVHIEQLNALFMLMKTRFPEGWSFSQLYDLVEKGKI